MPALNKVLTMMFGWPTGHKCTDLREYVDTMHYDVAMRQVSCV